MLKRIRNLFNCLNEKGVPIPFLRDGITKKPSVSLTMLVISFNLVVAGIIGKWSKAFGGIDPQQAIYLFGMCAGLYFSRKMTTSKEGKFEIDGKDEEK